MRFIISPSTDVHYNLAAESHYLHQTDENIFMLWRSEKAVVCGKHQNICAEINYAACRKLGIIPARRISGGGTVYHDLGNLNFSYIQDLNTSLDKAVNYKRFLEPIREALSNIGVLTTYSERDDLLFNGVKISGNAQHIFQQKKRVLHHGTILINANINSLGEALHSLGTYQDKAVKSNKSAVTNLADHFPQLSDVNHTINLLSQQIIKILAANPTPISGAENLEIISLSQSKFSQNNWILGYSPNYTLKRCFQINQTDYCLNIAVTKGIITQFQLNDAHNNTANLTDIEAACQKTIQQPISATTFHRAFANTPFEFESAFNHFF